MANNPQYGQFQQLLGQPQQTIPDKQKQPQGTGYTNLQTILNANQGNKLGQTVVGGVQKAGNQAQQSLNQAQNQFGQDINAQQNQLSTRQSQIQGTLGKLDQPNFQPGNITEGEAKGFQDLRNAQYNGPKGLQNSDQLQRQAQQAGQYSNLAGNREGRQELLRTMFGNGNYTPNQQRLDELFLAGSEPQLRQVAGAEKQIQGNTQRAVNNAANKANVQQQALQQLQQNTANTLNTRQTGLNTSINQELQNAQQGESARLQNIQVYQNAIAKGDMVGAANIAQQAGIDPNQQQDISTIMNLVGPQVGGALASGIQTGANNISRASAASPEERAKADAISKLMGGTQEFANYTPEQKQAAMLKLDPNVQHQIALSAQNQVYNPANFQSALLGDAGAKETAAQLINQENDPNAKQNLINFLNQTTVAGNPNYAQNQALIAALNGTKQYQASDFANGANPFTQYETNKMHNDLIGNLGYYAPGYQTESLIRQGIANQLAQKYLPPPNLSLLGKS